MRSAQAFVKQIPDYWVPAIWGAISIACLSVVIFYETWSSIVGIWLRSGTFAHGFLIVPISCWLIWTNRNRYQVLRPQSAWSVMAVIIGCGLIWLLADLTNVQVVKQYTAVGLTIAAIWMLLGHHVAFRMMMPLGFLLFMVPVGEDLIPPLMNYTANFTVGMLRLTGLSVYREGLHFTLTSGSWSVVEGCSGLRYLIASITLGVVYAYLTYSSYWKRAIFVVISIIVPVIANGLRAYMIVMIAHFSDMKLALGIDHYIYGGVFFGLVMLLLFFFGSFWKDTPQEESYSSAQNLTDSTCVTGEGLSYPQLVLLLLALAIVFSIWPITSAWLKNQQFDRNDLNGHFSALTAQGWSATDDPGWHWHASFNDPTSEAYRYFYDGEQTLGVYQAAFADELKGGGELVNSRNLIVRQKDKHWQQLKRTLITIPIGEESVTVEETILRRRSQEFYLQCLRWYQIGEKVTANPYLAKFYQLVKLLTADSSGESQVVVFTETSPYEYDQTKEDLKKIARNWIVNRY